MTDKPTDPVAQAREARDLAQQMVDEWFASVPQSPIADLLRRYGAAVRAECAADTKRLDWLAFLAEPTTYVTASGERTLRRLSVNLMWTDNIRTAIDAAMGGKP